MNGRIENRIGTLLRARKRRQRWGVLLLVLAVLAAAGPFYAFRMNAIAKTHQKRVLICAAESGSISHIHNDDCFVNDVLVCQLEEIEPHEHSSECFEVVLVCGLEESDGHQHDESCWAEETVLTCGLQEHVHDDLCYETVLICGEEESEETEEVPGHAHDESCYETVLVCPIDEHTHDNTCYETQQYLICGYEEGEGAHHHDASCYESVLTCEKPVLPVHRHTAECFEMVEMTKEEIEALGEEEEGAETEIADKTDERAEAGSGEVKTTETGEAELQGKENIPASDPYADVETEAEWTAAFENLELCGDWGQDLLTIAKTQIGYTESGKNYFAEQNDNGYTLHSYSRYGAWAGAPYADWNAIFAAFCIYYSGSWDYIPVAYDAAEWVELLAENEMLSSEIADLVFVDQDEDDKADLVGIVCGTEDENIIAIVGDHTVQVEEFGYDDVIAYGVIPQNPEYAEEAVEEPEITTEEAAQTPLHFEAMAGSVLVTVEADTDAFPVGTEMKAEPVYDEAVINSVADAASGSVVHIQAVDITFLCDGEEIEPTRLIRVTMTPAELPETDAVVEQEVIHIDHSGEATVVEQKESTENEVIFDADSFSVYAIAYVVIEKNVIASDGETYHISLSYDATAGIPENAELFVAEILPDTDEYKAYMQLTEETIENEMVSFARFFDIAIVADGEEIQPVAPVEVKIELADEMDDSVKAVHFGEGVEVIDAAAVSVTAGSEAEAETEVISEVSFSAESFSVYGVILTTLEKTITASDGSSYRINVTFGSDAKIPLDAELRVEEIVRSAITDESDEAEEADDERTADEETEDENLSEYDSYLEMAAEALGWDAGLIPYARFFNITILNAEGEKIQPADGTAVSVNVQLADYSSLSTESQVLHFGEEPEVLQNTADGDSVEFSASSFSVYAIVGLDSAETAASVDELNGNRYYLSLISGNNQYYYTNELNATPQIVRTTTLDSAAQFIFEETAADDQGNRFYIYTYDANGNKKYVNMTIASQRGVFTFDDEALTKYTVDLYTAATEETSATFHIYSRTAANEIYTWHYYSNNFGVSRNTKNDNSKIILTQIGSDDSTPSDPYGLDGQSLGILWNVNDTSGSAMMSTTGTANSQITPSDGSAKVTESIAVLKNKSTTVKIDPISRTDRVFVAQNSDISMWTFTCCGPAEYYITTVVNGQLKYVRFDDSETAGTGDKGVSLVDTPDERCKITVTEGTGSYSGKYKFSCNGRTLYNNNGNFFTKADTQNDQYVYMYFAEQSNLNDDDFVVYTAKKVSVSGPVNEDGTIDYEVKDGDQVVLYTRIWNDKTLEYEYYAIDYDGMLVRAYMSGDNISWVGSKVNTMLWDFTEYHTIDADGNETEEPNYYYELQNNYSGKYMAPQVSGEGFLSDSPIGINLNGRRYNEYYSTILAWDTPYYDYAMLMVPEKEYQLDAAPIALANDPTVTKDFYFAIMSNEETSGQLSTVQTVDHTGYVTVKMINYPGGSQSTANGNYHNMIQTNVLGATSKNGSVVYADLLKKNLSSNGYPDVAYTGYTGHNLSELYTDCTQASEIEVNHTFLASTYSETGYFEYDSTQNFAHLVASTEDIWYGQPMPSGGTYGVGDFVVYNQLATSSDSYQNYRNHGQFFPFNDLATEVTVDEDGNITDFTPKYAYHTSQFNTHDIKGNPLSSLDPRYGEKLYSITNNQSIKADPYIDHYFGMEMEASFMQSASGLDDWGHDLIFEFSGDDDFWLYVDGKLVLDLGGVHSACDGSVNFRTGEVNVNGKKTTLRALYKEAYLEEHPGASDTEVNEYLDGFFKDGGTVFKDYSGHTMKMFYMERGAGASNLHMRFNLAPYVDGEVQLEKEVSGTDTVSTAFPFQIWYKDKASARFVQIGSEGHDLSVREVSTGDPISHKDTDTIDGVTYEHVYFLTPGQTAAIQMPAEDTQYYIVECGIDPNTYDRVMANKEELTGKAAEGSDNLKDYSIDEDTVTGRKKVVYNNHVSDSAQKTLTVTKRLWREFNKITEIHSGTGDDADNTEFRFRIYIGPGTDKMVDGVGYAVYNTGKYYVKNSDGKYCIWQDGGFVSTGKTVFSELSTQKAAGEWKSEADKATFYTSPGGMADNIKAGYSIEIPDLMAGTLYYIEERTEETPSGYNLIGYTTTEGSYVDDAQSTAGNSGTIEIADENRTVSVHNQHGYGLVANKVWSDAPFMASHDDIYFGVYLNGELLADSVRCLHHPETSISWFFPELEQDKTLNDYQVYELELIKNGGAIADGDIDVDPATGKVTWGSGSVVTVIKKEEDASINIGGVSNEYGYSVSYSYTVGYERQELSAEDIANKVHSRTDTVSNSRPGIKFVKTDLAGRALAGAKFVLTDDSGTIRKTFTSAEDGLIVVSYLENDKVYTLTETAAPYGYQTLISSITIKKCVEEGIAKVYVNGDYVSGSVKDGNDEYELYTVSQVNDPTADNMPTITIRNKDYTLRAVKVDTYSNEPMKNVKFALYKEVYETVGGVPDPNYPMPDYHPMEGYDSLTTDANGVIPGIFMKNSETPGGLTAGTYYLREETPSGYNSLGFDIRITISDTGEVTLQSATRPAQSGHWAFGNVSENIATVAYNEGVMQITVKNTPKDPVRIKKLEMLSANKVLQGVGFALYKIGQIDDKGLPREGEEPIKSESTDDNGILLLGGLEENTSYYLFETEPLPGYNMLTGPVLITTAGPNTINASLNGTPLNCQRVTDKSGNYVWEITVYNSTGYELPSTGGPGTALHTFLGAILVILSGAALIKKKYAQ